MGALPSKLSSARTSLRIHLHRARRTPHLSPKPKPLAPNPPLTTTTTPPPPPPPAQQTKEPITAAPMASDESYAAFLEQANADPGVPKKKVQGVKAKTRTVDAEPPRVLTEVVRDEVYISEADEPWEVVSLRIEGEGLPDEVTFAQLAQHPHPEDAEVEIMDVASWDTQGQYAKLVDATREVTKGSDVMVYRIPREGARVEYWIVGVEGGRLLGVKALGIES